MRIGDQFQFTSSVLCQSISFHIIPVVLLSYNEIFFEFQTMIETRQQRPHIHPLSKFSVPKAGRIFVSILDTHDPGRLIAVGLFVCLEAKMAVRLPFERRHSSKILLVMCTLNIISHVHLSKYYWNIQ
jgi:hypothetical protein